MSTTTNLGLELVDPTSNEIFDYQKYVVNNLKTIDDINIGGRLGALEGRGGNLRIYSGTYTGTGNNTRTLRWSKASFTPLIIFYFPISGRETSRTLCVPCNWPDVEPTAMDVSAMRAFIPVPNAESSNDHTHVAFGEQTSGSTIYKAVTLSVDEGTDPKFIMNENGVSYNYILLGAKL